MCDWFAGQYRINRVSQIRYRCGGTPLIKIDDAIIDTAKIKKLSVAG